MYCLTETYDSTSRSSLSLNRLRPSVVFPSLPTAYLSPHPCRHTDKFDRYIVVSFTTATLVLSIGETVEEVTDTGLLASTGTLAVHLLGEDAIVQVATRRRLLPSGLPALCA